jgi:hypothetical protein
MAALTPKMQVEIADGRRVRVRVMACANLAIPILDLQAVVGKLLMAGQSKLKKTITIDLPHWEGRSPIDN